MYTIEPCCAERQLQALRRIIDGGGRDEIRGFADMSLTELMPALLTRYSETEMLIAAPGIPNQAAEIISRWVCWKWARADGKGTIDVVKRLTVIADLSASRSPMASDWLQDNPYEGSLTLIDKAQEDTAILLPDIAITGPMNLQYGRNFVCSVTTIQEEVDALWKQYSKLTRAAKRTAKRTTSGQNVEPAPVIGSEPVAGSVPEPAAAADDADKDQEDGV